MHWILFDAAKLSVGVDHTTLLRVLQSIGLGCDIVVLVSLWYITRTLYSHTSSSSPNVWIRSSPGFYTGPSSVPTFSKDSPTAVTILFAGDTPLFHSDLVRGRNSPCVVRFEPTCSLILGNRPQWQRILQWFKFRWLLPWPPTQSRRFQVVRWCCLSTLQRNPPSWNLWKRDLLWTQSCVTLDPWLCRLYFISAGIRSLCTMTVSLRLSSDDFSMPLHVRPKLQ